MRICYTSWSKFEAQFELERFKSLPMENEWVDGNIIPVRYTNGHNDIYLTTNGYNHKSGNFKKMTLVHESYTYLKNEYDNWFADKKWNHRFHFNPHYASAPNCSLQHIGSWWKSELPGYESMKANKRYGSTFGMVLGLKPAEKTPPYYHGWIRQEIVKECLGRSFKYYGTKWPTAPGYHGEAYIDGSKHSPQKFNDARRLMEHVKFVFAFENTYDAKYSVNYLTEKIFHAFLSCSIPIYSGCWNVEELINPNLFIDLRKYSTIKEALDYCEKMPDSEYRGYIDRIDEFLHGAALKMSCDERFVELDRKISALGKSI